MATVNRDRTTIDALGSRALAVICALIAGGVIHFARPLALSAQQAAGIEVRANVVAPGPLGDTRRAIEAMVGKAEEGSRPPAAARWEGYVGSPLARRSGLARVVSHGREHPPLGARTKWGSVVAVLEWEEGRAVITAADLSR